MNARLIAKGFINGFVKRGDMLFCQCVIQYAKQSFKCSLFVDKALTQNFIEIGALNDSGEFLASHFSKTPQVLCITNPVACIENDEIIYNGVLKIFTDYQNYKRGIFDRGLFWGVE